MQRSFAFGIATACLLAGAAQAQTTGYSDVPDTFRLEVGGFRIGSDTDLSFGSDAGLRPPVDFEDLNVPDSATRFYIEGFWRPGRRHQVSLSWFRNNREGDPKTVERDFFWGDRVITAGATVNGDVRSSFLSGAYRFAAYKNDRFEIGPAIGIGYLNLEASIQGEVSISGPGGTRSESFDLGKSLGQVTGDLGAYLAAWPMRRLLLRADFRYIIVKPGDSEASITDARASAIYHFVPKVGIGLQYTYTKFRYEREIASTDLGGSLRYSGGQLVLSAAF